MPILVADGFDQEQDHICCYQPNDNRYLDGSFVRRKLLVVHSRSEDVNTSLADGIRRGTVLLGATSTLASIVYHGSALWKRIAIRITSKSIRSAFHIVPMARIRRTRPYGEISSFILRLTTRI